MKLPTKEIGNGFEMPVLALGTWMMGGDSKRDMDYKNKEVDMAVIRKAVDLGFSRFDTSESYADGYSEEILGEAIQGFDRHKLFITSKVASWNLRHDDVLRAAENSLKRLRTNYLDLYLIHVPNPRISLSQTMKALDKLKEEGITKNIGVSNFSVERLTKAQCISNNKIILNQVHYNLLFREPELKGVLDYCQQNDIFLEAYRPIQQGNLSKPGIKILDLTSEKYSKTQTQIALNWLISQKNVIASVKTSSMKHLRDILGAVNWNMDEQDVELLKKDFPVQLDVSNSIQLI